MCCRTTARVDVEEGLHVEEPLIDRSTDDSDQIVVLNLSIQFDPLRAVFIPRRLVKTTRRKLLLHPCTDNIRSVSLCEAFGGLAKTDLCRICQITGRPLILPLFAKRKSLLGGEVTVSHEVALSN